MATVDIEWHGIDNLSGVADGVSGALSGLAGIAKGALSVAFGNILTGAMDKAGAALGEFWTGALDAEKGLAKFRNTLRLAGETAGLTEDAALDLAEKFKNLAGGSDDAIIAIQEMGLRMGITGGEMEGFIQSTLDLAAVTGNSESAAALLALAQEDVTAAMSKARRAGILLTEEQEEEIKALKESGDAAGATALFMDILAGKTEGMAESMAGTTGEKLKAFQERLMDIGEEALGSFLPMLTTAFDTVAPLIEDVAGKMGAFAQTVSEAIASGNIASLFPPELLTQIQPLIDAVLNLGAAFQSQLPAMQAQGQAFTEWASAAFGPVFQQILDNTTTAINALAEIWREHGDEIMTAVRIAFEFIAATIGGTIELVSGIVTAALQLLSGDWQGAMDTMGASLTGFMELALSIAGTNLAEFTAIWSSNWTMLQTIVSAVVMNITSGFQTFIINIINAVKEKLPEFLTLGQLMVQNMLLGITMLVSQVISTVVGMVKSALAAAGEVLGFGVPGGSPGATGTSTTPKFAEGGIASGPTSGFPAILHGTEAVIPLQNGSVPVQMSGGGAGGAITVNLVLDSGVLLKTVQLEARANGLQLVSA